MADYQLPRPETSKASSMKRKKKRKLPDSEKKHEEKAWKAYRVDQSSDFVYEPIEEDKETTMGVLEDSSPWRNLQLILSLQDKNLDIEKKVERAYNYVKLSSLQLEDDTAQSSEVVSFERVIIFLNNWIQSTLISSEKKIRLDGIISQFGVSGSCLDYRCWKIFNFCLEGGIKLHVSMSFARDILKVIHCIARNTEMKDFNDEELTLYNTMLDCISSIFTSHGGVSNENLDLWILVVGTVLELVLKLITNKLVDTNSGTIIMNLTCLVLEPFTKFLRLHPNRKNGFHDFVDRLLEPLLCLLHMLHKSVVASNPDPMSKLLKLIEEVLSQGLFHSSHIDGFLSLHSLTRYKLSDDGKPKDSKFVIKSYHRHLFDKLGRILVEKKALTLFGEGELFRLYVICIKRQEGVEVTEGSRRFTYGLCGSHTVVPEKSQRVLNAEIRKSLFDFFVQIMEPFLGDISTYVQDEVEVGSVLESVHCTLKSINSILIILMEEKIYVRVDDTSEGACANFLKLISDKITLLSFKVGQIVSLTYDETSGTCKELVEVTAKELVLCIRYLLEIDYEVFGNDLENLWLLMFSYGTLGNALTNFQDKSLISEILHLGSHMVNLYSELRQVGTSVFALCKALRRLVSFVRDIEINYSESWTKSLRLILCSQELRLSIHNAVKSIPEGQVSLCIQELVTDVSESLEWMKDNLGNLCHEVVGNGLSEVYALILDSLIVTFGNSSLVGVSLNNLISVVRPIMSVLISKHTDGVHKFLLEISECKDESFSAYWYFVFFFRLYMSSRSLYRQVVSLAPPITSKKMSEMMGDSITAYSGNEWLEKTEKDKGYFCWISQSSVSLFFIIEAISGIFSEKNGACFYPLTYVLSAMAIQRLADLKRLINSFEFMIKRSDMMDGMYSKQNKRLQKRLSKLAEEAKGLTNYLMGNLSLSNKCQLNISSGEDVWSTAVATIDSRSLPCAIWCIACQNIDIWGMHATKKKLKMFLSILLKNSLPYASNNFKQFGENNNAGNSGELKTLTRREISLELLSNTMLYEEKFIRRHMASRFCKFLKELVSPFFNNGTDIELQVQPNWPEVLNSLKIPSVVSNNTKVVNEGSSRETCSEQQLDPSARMIYTVCESSLNFLSWMTKRFIDSKSFSLYGTCILNLERLLVGTLLVGKDTSLLHDDFEVLRLFLCCRKTLKDLTVSFCEESMKSNPNSLNAMHFGGKFPTLWLLNSVLSVQQTFSEGRNAHMNDLLFSLMDHTSFVFLALSKGSFVHSSHYLISSRKSFQQKNMSTFDQEENGHLEGIESCNFMIHIAEALKDHSQSMIAHQIQTTNVCDLQKLSSIAACLQGFLWGLTSTLSYMDTQNNNNNLKAVFSRKNFEPTDKLKRCIDTYMAFVNKFLCELVLQDDNLHRTVEKSFNLKNVEIGSARINRSFLHSLLAGENLEAAFFLRQLFIMYSAILRLNLQIKTCVSLNMVNIFIGILEILLVEFSNKAASKLPSIYMFLDGIGKFLEELANHLDPTNPTLPTEVYERLVDLHLKVIGKYISLQGKGATLESHETESSTKMINDPESASFCALDIYKSRLRTSFKVFVRKPSELYISSAVQSIKKALVGLQEDCMANYQIYTGNSGGGTVSSFVAAGVDCLDLVLEAITGRKGLTTVKTDILSSVCCLFNVILHLQGPQIFYKNPVSEIHNCTDPDPGSVVLMCIEVLTKVSGKHALYQMEACHVAQALGIPATLFQNILHLRTSEDKNNKSMNGKLFDRQFSIELYAECCRMLYTFLRHHKRESSKHIAQLQSSVSVLLHCLEMVNKEKAFQEGNFVWGLQEGVRCSAFLRRIYEEIRQQKDVIGQDCRLFLSSYIMVYSGCGPLKVGISREIDEALRPGVYALIDSCSPDDLQYVHTVLGEGPCRNTLANLQHDYKLNFQYEGKV